MTTFTISIEEIIKKCHNTIEQKTRKSRVKDALGFGEGSSTDGDIWLKEYVSNIADDVYTKLVAPLAVDIETPYVNGILDDTENIIYKAEFPTTFDINTTPTVLSGMINTIVTYAVFMWLKDLAIPGWELEEDLHNKTFDNLRSLFHARKSVVKRSYSGF